MTKLRDKTEVPSPFRNALPGLGIGKDKLMLRLDFYGECIVMEEFAKKGRGRYRIVSPHDLLNTMANQLSYSSGLLPPNTLWWANGRGTPTVALWVEPGMRRLALQTKDVGAPERYNVPLPGLIFICHPAHAPAVFAAYKRPAGPKEKIYKAPLANVYDDGRSCAGSNRYPDNIAEIPNSFLNSFFTRHIGNSPRSKMYPNDVTLMWKYLDKKKAKEYPLSDLQYHGTVADLMVRA